MISEFEDSLYPSGRPTPSEAWLGFYQVLWWFVGDPLLLRLEALKAEVGAHSPELYIAAETVAAHFRESGEEPRLHIREANDLRKPIWVERAKQAEQYIADALGVPRVDLPQLFERMMRLDRWSGQQRNNPLGNGLRMLICESLRRWGNPLLSYQEEQLATDWFPTIKMPGRSKQPKVDVVALKDGDPRALISCKWSIRHDRISDPTNECQEYRAAAIKRQLAFSYYVLTNEMDWQRLEKVLNQPCVDALVHVHLDLVEHLAGGQKSEMRAAREQGRILDLREFITHTSAAWA